MTLKLYREITAEWFLLENGKPGFSRKNFNPLSLDFRNDIENFVPHFC